MVAISFHQAGIIHVYFSQAAGRALPSFTSRNLEEPDGSPDHEDHVKYAGLTFYTGTLFSQ